MKFVPAIFFLLLGLNSKAQISDSALLKEDIFVYVEQMPEFNGNIVNYIATHLAIPNSCAEQATSRAIVKFIVDKFGKARMPEVLRGWGMPCDAAIIKLVNDMPAWKPGKQNGRAVNVYYQLPMTVRF